MRVILILLSLIFLSPISVSAQVPPVVAATASVSPVVADSEQAIPELATPRLTLDTFLKQMESYASGDANSIELAISCLDLSDIPEFIRKEQGVSLAVKLHSILSKTKIEFWKVPSKDLVGPFSIRSDEFGQVVLDKNHSNWRFSKSTIRNIPELFFNLKDQKTVRDTTLIEPKLSSRLNLRQYVPELFSNRIFSLEVWQLVGILIALLVVLIIQKFCSAGIRTSTAFLANKFSGLKYDSISRVAAPLATIIAVYVYHFSLYVLDLDPVIYSTLLRVLLIIKILAVFILVARILDLLSAILQHDPNRFFGGSGQILIPLGRTISKFTLYFVGLILIANLFSINLTGLLAGLGIGGLALALAAKDTIENLFGSLTVIIDKPFQVGDFIKIEEVSGTVENIGVRSTKLRTPENSLMTIPNSKLISAIVDNLGARQFFRTRLALTVTYETPVDKLQQFCESLRELLKNNPSVRYDYFVHLNEFATSSLNIVLQAYFQANSYANHLAKQEELYIQIIKLAQELGVDFAYPVQRHVQ